MSKKRKNRNIGMTEGAKLGWTTEAGTEDGQLLPTEWVLEGQVYDTRRLTQEAHC